MTGRDTAAAEAAHDGDAGRARRGPAIMVAASVGVVLLIIVAVALRPGGQSPAASGQPSAEGGAPPSLEERARFEPMPLPAVTLPSLRGFGPPGGRDLAELRGRPLLINFWASWCDPCVKEMPALQRVADDTGVTVLGVDYIDQEDKAIELAERLGITYELVRDDDGEFGRQVGLMGTPTTLFVDRDGTIVRRLTGELTEEQMREVIAAELQ